MQASDLRTIDSTEASRYCRRAASLPAGHTVRHSSGGGTKCAAGLARLLRRVGQQSACAPGQLQIDRDWSVLAQQCRQTAGALCEACSLAPIGDSRVVDRRV